ncbi:MAG: hypothetical protein IJN92_10585 [Lachnospiraceae bacterium]|nr:hypothetical protein [Lachnospiraceae bacterium]
MPVLAETATATTNSTLITSLTEGLKTVAADMTTSLSSVLPVALGVVGGVMVITFGVKIFKKITGK